jgi:hypothetical protein
MVYCQSAPTGTRDCSRRNWERIARRSEHPNTGTVRPCIISLGIFPPSCYCKTDTAASRRCQNRGVRDGPFEVRLNIHVRRAVRLECAVGCWDGFGGGDSADEYDRCVFERDHGELATSQLQAAAEVVVAARTSVAPAYAAKIFQFIAGPHESCSTFPPHRSNHTRRHIRVARSDSRHDEAMEVRCRCSDVRILKDGGRQGGNGTAARFSIPQHPLPMVCYRSAPAITRDCSPSHALCAPSNHARVTHLLMKTHQAPPAHR